MIGMMGVKGYGQINFQKAYGGNSDDIGEFVQQTFDGGYILVGETYPIGGGNVYLIKTNAYGDTLWTRAFGENSGAYGTCVRQTFDGGYIIAGRIPDDANYTGYVYLIKTNSGGDTLWTKELGEGGASSIQQTTDGGYIIGGSTSCDMCTDRLLLIKTDNLGDTLWSRIFDAEDNDGGASVQQTIDGGYIIAGSCQNLGNPGFTHVYIIKTDSNGDTLWTKTYGDSALVGYDYGASIQQTNDGGYIIVGGTNFGAGNRNVYLIKINSIGDLLWSIAYGGARNNYGNSVQQTIDGGFIIAGSTSSFSDTLSDVYLIKTNSVGDTLWTRTYGGSNYDYATSVHQTFDGGYIIAGYTSSFGAGGNDLYLIKTDSNGNVGCNEGRTSTIISFPPTQVIPETTFVRSGFLNHLEPTLVLNGGTVTTICSDEGINEVASKNSISLYPNPTSGTFTLSIRNYELGIRNGELSIFDVLGQVVYTQPIINQESTIINLPQLSNGVYFYQLSNSKETLRGKFVKN